MTEAKAVRARRVRALALGAGSALAWLAASPAFAQAVSPSDPPQDAQSSARVDEVVVTARRRAESLQDVPVSVSAFSERRLQELQADDLSGIQYSVPNLYLDKGDASNAVIYIRGVGQNDSLAFADPGVGVYLDDVFIARTQAAFLQVFDVDRIEVLRGPQGTLYGRNTIGGAVKFVSAPAPKEWGGYIEVGAGDYGEALVQGRYGGPVTDTLRVKGAFTYERRDGYSKNLFNGEDDGDQDTLAGRVTVDWTPTDKLEFVLNVDGKRDSPSTSQSPVRVTPITGFTNGQLLTLPALTNPYRPQTNANGLNDVSGYGVALTSRYKVNDHLTLESISAYRGFNFNLKLDTDGSPLPILDILLREDDDQYSQELRATGTFGPVTGVAGFYYFHDNDNSFSGFDDGAATIFGFPVTAFGFPSSELADTRQVTTSYAGFVDLTWAVTPKLSLTAGARYTNEDRRSGRTFENFFNPAVSVINNEPPFGKGVGVPGAPISGEADFDAFTPKFSASYKVTPAVLAYVSYSEGFKSGGFDGRASSQFQFQPFRPEFVDAYEGGLKTSWFDGRLVVNAAYFYNDYTDVQVTSFGADPVTGVFTSLFTNAAAATIQGGEIEASAKPLPGLRVDASLGVLDAHYDKFQILNGTTVTDASNRRLVNTPPVSASLALTYDRPLFGRLDGEAHVDANYRGETATEITDSPLLRQPEYVNLNAFLALRTSDNRWEARLGVKNLTDVAVRRQGFNLDAFPGVEVAFFNPPRTYDVRLIHRF